MLASGPRVSLRLACGSSARCVGTITESVTRRERKHGKPVSSAVPIGRDSFDLAAGSHATKTVLLDAAGRRDLAAAAGHRLVAHLEVALKTGAHARTTVTLS